MSTTRHVTGTFPGSTAALSGGGAYDLGADEVPILFADDFELGNTSRRAA